MLNTADIQSRVRQFAQERDWEQFHTPKNIAMALSVECAELLEHFQWLTPAESAQLAQGPKARAIAHELADVTVYLLRLADLLQVDLQQAVDEKLALNAQKYPVEKSKGNARKYDEL